MSITTFTVTVVSTASGNKYAINGVTQDSVYFLKAELIDLISLIHLTTITH